MGNNFRLLDYREFAGLKLRRMEAERKLVRDVHLTLQKAIQDKDDRILFFTQYITVKLEDDLESKTLHWAFFVSDDSEYYYFFDCFWPERYDDFLREEDVIESHVSGIDISKTNLKRVLKELNEENARFVRKIKPESVVSDDHLRKQLNEKGIDWSRGVAVLIPYTSTTDVLAAWAGGNEKVAAMIGKIHHPFTKALKRTRGGKIERYNSKKQKWEECEGCAVIGVDMKLASLYEMSEA